MDADRHTEIHVLTHDDEPSNWDPYTEYLAKAEEAYQRRLSQYKRADGWVGVMLCIMERC